MKIVYDPHDNRVRAIEITVGLKIMVRDFILENLKNDPYIINNYKLNVKRLNRWWYSVYFDEKNKGGFLWITQNHILFHAQPKK